MLRLWGTPLLYLNLIPPNNVTDDDGWIRTNSTIFNAQETVCSYTFSSGYQRAPRYLFYLLIIIALCSQRSSWIAGVVLGSGDLARDRTVVSCRSVVFGR